MTTNTLAARPRSTTHAPIDHAPVLVSVAEVMLVTAATPSAGVRSIGAMSKLRTALSEAWAAWRTHSSLRDDYLESAAMAREMHRL